MREFTENQSFILANNVIATDARPPAATIKDSEMSLSYCTYGKSSQTLKCDDLPSDPRLRPSLIGMYGTLRRQSEDVNSSVPVEFYTSKTRVFICAGRRCTRNNLARDQFPLHANWQRSERRLTFLCGTHVKQKSPYGNVLTTTTRQPQFSAPHDKFSNLWRE
ncbi:hypothetical protein PROFUN_15998 [Planoprotostelium fungivorum]|uniref:Uncharacterized protein n=1 Tax=Planoprotostelium fungivorum TaxID=1890364 RepID=A0A2P6MTD9_9EUKA|nr:hypothetical protein PROFUN_15998 [Planoprotostelium fungivorum]